MIGKFEDSLKTMIYGNDDTSLRPFEIRKQTIHWKPQKSGQPRQFSEVAKM